MAHRQRGQRRQQSGPPQLFAGVDRGLPAAKRRRVTPDRNALELHGTACTLYDASDAAAIFDGGQQLLTAFDDDSVTVDRFDARLLLTAPPSLPRAAATAGDAEEQETLDEERYRDLHGGSGHTSEEDADNEGAAAASGTAVPYDYYGGGSSSDAPQYQEVGFSYAAEGAMGLAAAAAAGPADKGGPSFTPPFTVPDSLQGRLPPTAKQHQVIQQTAAFVREAGRQSEFRLGMQQAGNPNFGFLRPEDRLFPYYRWVLDTNPQEERETPAEAAERASSGPSGLDMLAATYDTDQASDPPTPRADGQPPPAAADPEQLHTAGPDASCAAGSAAADGAATLADEHPPPPSSGPPAAEAVAAGPAATAPPAQPGAASADTAEPHPQPVAALPAPPPDVGAIIDKLVAFVKVKGVAVGQALAKREAANPRFGFLQPAHAWHGAYRAAAEAALAPEAATQLLPPLSDVAATAQSAAKPAVAAAEPEAEVQRASEQQGVAEHAQRPQQAAPGEAAGPAAVTEQQPGDGTTAAAGQHIAKNPASARPAAAALKAVSAASKAHYFSAPQRADAQPVAAPQPAAASVAPASVPPTSAALPGATAVAAGPAAAALPAAAAIRANPQLAQRMIGPQKPPKPASPKELPPWLASFGHEDDDMGAPAAASAAPARKSSSPPPWLAAKQEALAQDSTDADGAAASGSGGTDSPEPAAQKSELEPEPEPAPLSAEEADAAAKKARRLKAVREALAAKQRAAVEAAAAAAKARAEAEAEKRREAAEAAARRRRLFLGEDAPGEPAAAQQPAPLLKPRLSANDMWERLNLAGGADGGSEPSRGGSRASQSAFGGVGHIMAQLHAADAAAAAAEVAGVEHADGTPEPAGGSSSDGSASDGEIREPRSRGSRDPKRHRGKQRHEDGKRNPRRGKHKR